MKLNVLQRGHFFTQLLFLAALATGTAAFSQLECTRFFTKALAFQLQASQNLRITPFLVLGQLYFALSHTPYSCVLSAPLPIFWNSDGGANPPLTPSQNDRTEALFLNDYNYSCILPRF
jgi:hypothetical protein